MSVRPCIVGVLFGLLLLGIPSASVGDHDTDSYDAERSRLTKALIIVSFTFPTATMAGDPLLDLHHVFVGATTDQQKLVVAQKVFQVDGDVDGYVYINKLDLPKGRLRFFAYGVNNNGKFGGWSDLSYENVDVP